MKQRRHDRFEINGKAYWDYFAKQTGKKIGIIGNISNSGCLLKAGELIEHRRWLRILIQDESQNIFYSSVGRVVRRQSMPEIVRNHCEPTYYHYGIEFTYPNYWSLASTDLILDFSRRNLTVRSCLSLNSKSSIRPGFLA